MLDESIQGEGHMGNASFMAGFSCVDRPARDQVQGRAISLPEGSIEQCRLGAETRGSENNDPSLQGAGLTNAPPREKRGEGPKEVSSLVHTHYRRTSKHSVKQGVVELSVFPLQKLLLELPLHHASKQGICPAF